MKYRANGKTTKANVYGPIFANFSRKNKGEREMKNQSAGLVFSTSISYIEKKWKREMGRLICWSCSKLFTIYRGV